MNLYQTTPIPIERYLKPMLCLFFLFVVTMSSTKQSTSFSIGNSNICLIPDICHHYLASDIWQDIQNLCKCEENPPIKKHNEKVRVACSMIVNCADCYTIGGNEYCIQCKEGYYYENATICNPCSAFLNNCSDCTATNICTNCTENYTLYDGKCNTCLNQFENCKSCNETGQCAECNDGYYLNITEQLISCELCSKITPNCIRCNNQICNACEELYILNISTNTCFLCSKAIQNCQVCDPDFGTCSKCKTNYFTNNTQTKCWECNALIPNCKTCESSTICGTCIDNFVVDKNKTCTLCQYIFQKCYECNSAGCLKCISNEYRIVGGICKLCSLEIENCLTCDNQQCLSCIQQYYPLAQQCNSCRSAMKQCITCQNQTICTECQPQYYVDQTFHNCSSCNSFNQYCSQCSGRNICTKCILPSYLKNNNCKLCKQLITNCLTCNTDGQICQTCSGGYVKINDTFCQLCGVAFQNCSSCNTTKCETCLNKYGFNIDHICLSCSDMIPHCSSCSDFTSCENCENKYYALNNTCLNCSQKFENCLICNESECIYCSPQYHVSNNICEKSAKQSGSDPDMLIYIGAGAASILVLGGLVYTKRTKKLCFNKEKGQKNEKNQKNSQKSLKTSQKSSDTPNKYLLDNSFDDPLAGQDDIHR